MSYLALDFGGTFVKYGVLNDEAEITDSGKVPAPLDSTEQFVEVIAKLYEQFKGKVEGVAISMPGIINSETGFARTAGAFSKTMAGKNIIELLAPVIDVPVAVENDGKAAILAEMWKGALKGVKDGAACIIGSGLGGGILMDGKLRKGSNFASGEISVLMTVPGSYAMHDFAACKASMSTFLTMVAAAKGMSPADFEISGFMGGVDDGRKKIGGVEVFQWIEAGDEAVIAVYKKWLDELIAVLFNLKITLDPEKIVIGGGVSRNPVFMRDLKAEWEKPMAMMASAGFPGCELDVCRFSSDANLIGAVYNWILQNRK